MREWLISVIIPSYNRHRTIHRCVDSVLHQTYKNLEIIIVDDGSIPPYKISGRRIKLIRNERNQGLAASKNRGIRASRGKGILVVDDDIILTPTYVERLVEDLKKWKNKGVGAVGGRLLYPKRRHLGDDSKPLVEISRFGNLKFRAWKKLRRPAIVPLLHSCSLFLRSVFDTVGTFDEAYKGNYTFLEPDFFFRMRRHGYKLLFEPNAVAYHLQEEKGGCKSLRRLKYNLYTARNSFVFLKKFYGGKSLYLWLGFLAERLVKTLFRNREIW